MRQDRAYVIKKFQLSDFEFERIMAEPGRSHFDYPSDRSYLRFLFAAKALLRKLRLLKQQ